MAKIVRNGYGQVEPNHLSAQRTGQIYAQGYSTADVLENGQFVKYNGAGEAINLTGAGEWMLVYNEVKLYGEKANETTKDFALLKSKALDGKLYPRVFKTNVGDQYTTNMVATTANNADISYAAGDHLVIDATTGILTKDAQSEGEWTTTTGMIWVVVKVTNLPDGQSALKLMRVQ